MVISLVFHQEKQNIYAKKILLKKLEIEGM